jgi:AcrR family transcriptional regulator
MTDASPGPGRERSAQKSRTREAILAAARHLLAEGRPLSVTEAAARAGVSKATAYRYFSDPAALAAEAALAVEVRSYEEVTQGAGTLREKLLAISIYFLDFALDHEPAFRQFLARNLDAWAAEGGRPQVRRGARRVAMYERALSEAGLAPDRHRHLVAALATATGTEAMIALLDIVRTDADTARQTVRWLAEAAIDRTFGPDRP